VTETLEMRILQQSSLIQSMVSQKQQENVEYFNHFGSMMTNGTRCSREIKSRIAMAKRLISSVSWIITRCEVLLNRCFGT
jgi:hypothetical protein